MDVRKLDRIGPYKVTRYIDEGAFAWVFEVVDPKFEGRRLALKMLMPEAAAGEEFRRFESEARLLAGIDHPNIVTIFDFGREEKLGNFYYTMTFVEGETLRQRLARGPLPVEEACRIFIEILDGLAHLHDKRIVHRDIKPANVLIGKNGRSRLSDLGIARVETERSQTRTGTAVGTALYMSPEQARGRPVDTRSDLFSVGLTLYEALTGNVVYDHVDSVDSSSGMDVLIYIGGLDQQKNAEFKLVFPPEPPIPRSVKRVLQKACRLRAEDRYQDAREMRDALREALDGYLRSPQGEAVPFKWVAAGGGGLALLAAVLGVWFGFLQPRMSVSEDREIALQVLEETSQREQTARQILDAVGAMRPAPAPELMDDVERQIARGDVYFDDGRDNVSAGEEANDVEAYRSAVTYLRDAQPHYDGACEAMNAGFLAAQAEREVATAVEAVAALRADGAAEAGLAAWPELEALLPTLAAPEGLAGCALANTQLGRVRTVAQVSVTTATAMSQLEEAWPRLAEEMRQGALHAREIAVEPAIDTHDFRMAVREGKRELLRGDQGLAAGDYRAARDAYRTSQQAFQEAAALRNAARGAEAEAGAS
jgi:aminoglycoside phosphotransferase (APT) family kinase protein